MEQESEIQDSNDATYETGCVVETLEKKDTSEIKPHIVKLNQSFIKDEDLHIEMDMENPADSDTESGDEDFQIGKIKSLAPDDNSDDEIGLKPRHNQPEEIKCVVCKTKILQKKSVCMDIYNTKSSSTKSLISDVILDLVLKDYSDDFEFKDTTLCKRCFGLIDRAELLDQQIKLNKSELDKIQNELRTNLIEDNNEISGSKKEDSLEKKIESEEMFDCMICFESNFNSKDKLLNHLDRSHRNEYIINCCICSDDIPGGLGDYICHMKFDHHHLTMEDGLAIIKYKPEIQKIKGKRKVKAGSNTATLPLNIKKELDFEEFMKEKLNNKNDLKLLCPLCDVPLPEDEFEEHICENLSAESSYKCNYCFALFFDRKTFFVHLIAMHKWLLQSDAVDKTKRDELVIQLMMDDDKNANQNGIISCPICSKSLKSSSFRSHYYRIHKKEKSYQCKYCEHKSFRNSDLNMHMKVMHNIKRPIDIKREKLQESEDIDGKKFVKCKECDVKVQESNLHMHFVRFHTKYKCPICDEEIEGKRNLNSHKLKEHGGSRSRNQIKVNCPVCGVTVCKGTLRRHINDLHTFQRKYPCNICEEVFNTSSILRTHKRTAHSIGMYSKKHKCTLCDAHFINPSEVKTHIKTTHENKRDHLCDICGESFLRVNALKDHKNTHFGIKPYICNICNKPFSQKGIRGHVKKVHKMALPGRLNDPFTKHLLPYTKIDVQRDDGVDISMEQTIA